jgi:putative ABC transport system permease protein
MELGATNVIIRSKKPPQGSSRDGESMINTYGLLREDYDRIVSTIPTIVRAVPMREITKEVRYRDRTADTQFLGCTPDYAEISHLTMSRGRFLSDRDLEGRENVAVIGHETAELLFPYEDPIGKTIRVDKEFYRVVGQTNQRQASASIGGSLEGRDFNLDVYIPLTTFRARIGDIVITARSGSREGEQVELNQITLTVADVEQVDRTAAIITTLLEKFHKDPDYAVIVPKELLRQAEILRMMFNVLLVLIAGISLLVGGIGIMNIMLATVTERTREIGIRRALGAKRRDIIEQFLTETALLSAAGGILGVVFGVFCRPAIVGLRISVQQFFPDLIASLPPNIQSLEPRVAPWSIIVAFVISLVVGVTFGLYPASRAARMDPIEALRHE